MLSITSPIFGSGFSSSNKWKKVVQTVDGRHQTTPPFREQVHILDVGEKNATVVKSAGCEGRAVKLVLRNLPDTSKHDPFLGWR